MGKKAVGYLLYNFFILGTVLLFLLAVSGWRAASVDPVQNGSYLFLGLALPVLLVVNFAVLVYWCIRRKVWLLFPLAALLLNIGYMTALYQWPWGKTDPRTPDLKIATYNIHAFREHKNGIKLSVNEISEFFQREKVDVICLEEFVPVARYNLDSIMNGFSDWPHVAAGVAITIFSKYPIADAEVIPFPDTDNSALWVDLLVRGERVRVLAVHLQTTGVNPAKREFDAQSRELSVEGGAGAIMKIGNNYRYNSEVRSRQVARLQQMTDTLKMPLIVCGDFNDTPSSYTYRAMKGDLTDGFKSCGKGYGTTFRSFKNLLRIDYIFYSNDFSGIRYYAPDVPYSDHRPVLLELAFQRQS